ncbi:hypothetical protein ACW7GZ_13825 [Luteimonas sp. A537]
MSRSARRSLLRNALATLIAFDLVASTSFIAYQWLGASMSLAWGIAMALAFPVFALSWSAADAVLVMADRHAGIPDTGEQIPRTGQCWSA